jgi:hypothetical protein
MVKRESRKIVRLLPPEFPGEPPSEPPSLNPTANWYSQDAWNLFAEIAQRCGLPTAKYLFQSCITEADNQERAIVGRDRAKAAQRARELTKLPTAEQVASADRQKICNWYARLPSRKFRARERPIVDAIFKRYIAFGGYPVDFKENLPPIKKRGAVKRNAANAELMALFDESNPESGWSIAKRRGSTKTAYAATLVPRHGATADHVLANLRYRRRAKI